MIVDFEGYKGVVENVIPFHQFMNLELKEVKEGYAKLRMPFKPELIGDPRKDWLHGGIVASLVDSAAGAAAITTLTTFEDKLATVDMRVDYLRPAQAYDVIAEAKIVRNGKHIIVVHVTTYHFSSKDVIAEGRVTLSVSRLKAKRDKKASKKA